MGEEPVLTPEARRMNVAAPAQRPGGRRTHRRCASRQIPIDSVTVQKPSLDEVFLALTGHDTHESRPAPTPDETGTDTPRPGGRAMTTITTIDRPRPDPTATGPPAPRQPADTVSQTMTMAWRATLKMRRNFEQFFDVTIQPLLFTAMFAYIFGGAISGDVDRLPADPDHRA